MKYIISTVAITFLLVAIYTWREARRMRRMDSRLKCLENPPTFFFIPDRRDYLPGPDGDARFAAAMQRFDEMEIRWWREYNERCGVHTGSDRHKED